MKPRMIRFSSNTWQAAKEKAGITPLSAIIRQLINMWLADEVEVETDNPPMKIHTTQCSDSTWEAAKEKADTTPLSVIIRRLVKLWLADEIEVMEQK